VKTPGWSTEGIDSSYSFLPSALDGGERSASRSGRALPPGKRTHWIEGWVGPRVGLDAKARRKTFAPAGERTPVIQSVVIHCTD
jgi:hypothetical protein